MGSNPGAVEWLSIKKKKKARQTIFLLGGRYKVFNALGSMPAEWGGAFLIALIVFLIWCYRNKPKSLFV